MKIGREADPFGHDSTDGLPAVGGQMMEGTIAAHIRSCRVLLADEQRKPSPDNALVAVLCNSVRLAREAGRWMGER